MDSVSYSFSAEAQLTGDNLEKYCNYSTLRRFLPGNPQDGCWYAPAGRFLAPASLEMTYDKVLIRPGVSVPANGEVIEGQSEVKEANFDIELTGVQALERKRLSLPLQPGKVERREYEYIRHGTWSFIVNFEVATGQSLGGVDPQRGRLRSAYPTDGRSRADGQQVALHRR